MPWVWFGLIVFFYWGLPILVLWQCYVDSKRRGQVQTIEWTAWDPYFWWAVITAGWLGYFGAMWFIQPHRGVERFRRNLAKHGGAP